MTVVSSQQSERRAPRRMQDLATLPVFFRLSGRKAVVAGGSEAAAWKAELLAAAGAEVHVFAQHLDPVFAALIDEGDRYVHHAHPLDDLSLEDASIAIIDAETEEEARDFSETCRRAGVPVNVIDKPAFCDFQFGSIVNRSPAVIAISTDGAAPILGQAIRRRIETVLPHSLADWAALAGRIRGRITENLKPGPQRRAFWERFVDRAFGSAPSECSIDSLIDEAGSIAVGNAESRGRVTLVGAGPGDPELLTLKVVRALQAADVILFDDLVSDEVLELARREARRMLVGKRGGRESCRQEDINDLMVALAKSGKNVVRLKGGDPMIFGRAGEEIARLDSEGVPVEVVPGITAASAMAAALGVSLTHRYHAQSVRLVTGHSRHGGLPPEIDWSSLADPSTTTVFYMGRRVMPEIAAKLCSRGLSGDTPVVVAQAIGRPNARSWRLTLKDLSSASHLPGRDEPVLIGVGRVFASRADCHDLTGAMPMTSWNAPSHCNLFPRSLSEDRAECKI